MLISSKETFQVYYFDDERGYSRPYGATLHSIEAVRKRIKNLKQMGIGSSYEVIRTVVLVTSIGDGTNFNS